ncbi:acyltransferase family protein [Pseudomonas fluorescens]|nr:acyltransferase [Pseudomonas fluorescens]
MLSKRINEIDLLRFIAAMAVVLFHYSFRGYYADDMTSMHYPALEPVAKYGYLGVELFFMISGFVILMSVSGESIRQFFVSRVTRLYPAFWACCTLTFLVSLAIGGEKYSPTFLNYFKNMTMLGGFFGVPSIDGVYWSLFVEMMFYSIIAALLAIRQMHRVEIFLILWIVATIVIEAIDIKPLRLLFITSYSCYFIAGAFFYKVWHAGATPKRMAAIIACLLITSYQSVMFVGTMDKIYGTGFSSVIACVINVLMFAVMYLVATGKTGVLKNKTWKTLGALTYPLYLIHQFVGFMIFNYFESAVNTHVLFWGVLALMLCVSYAVNVLVERKLSGPMKSALYKFLQVKSKKPVTLQNPT